MTVILDFRAPGVERFKTLPLDATDGLWEPRRQFHLPEADQAFLASAGWKWETIIDSFVKWIILHEYPIPAGYKVGDKAGEQVDIALRIEAQYPMAQIDMAYFSPGLSRADGKALHSVSTLNPMDGRAWQQWSRHRTGANPWRPGVDDLETHLLLVDHWLQAELKR